MRNGILSSKRKRLVVACLFLGLALVCVRCTLYRSPDPDVLGFVQSIDESELRGYSDSLAAIGSRPGNNEPKTELTTRFIEDELRDAGFEALDASPENTGDEGRYYNIVAEIKGTRYPDRVVELGAHYDTIPFSPGADDNGSGVAGVLAVAHALASARCEKTIRFVFYCLEDMGGGGSLTHVQNILQNQGEEFEGAIVFEMIGYSTDEPDTQQTPVRIPFVLSPPRTGSFITVVGNGKSGSIGNRYEGCAKRYVPDLEYYSLNRMGGMLKDAARSDHAAYWESNLPAIMLTDTANFRNPNYHQLSDRIDTLDFEFMTAVTCATAATLLEWAKVEEPEGEGRINEEHTENTLTFYREPCTRKAGAVPLENADIGLSTNGLSREEACREIVTRYFNAVIDGDEALAAKLWSSFPSGETMHWHEQSRPRMIIDVGQPHTQERLDFGAPTLVTPTRIQWSNDKITEMKLIVIFRDLGMEESCILVGIWEG